MNFENLYHNGYDGLITNVKIEPYKDETDLVIFSYDDLSGKTFETQIYVTEDREGKNVYSEYARSLNGMVFSQERVISEPRLMRYIGNHHEQIIHPSRVNISKWCDGIPQYTEEAVNEHMKEHITKVQNRIKELNDKAEEDFKLRQEDQKAFHDKMDLLAKEVESESIWDFLRSLFKGNKK